MSVVRLSASTFFGSEPPVNAFDGSPTTYWTTNGVVAAWIAAMLSPAITAVGYRIRRRDDLPARNPQDWTFEGAVGCPAAMATASASSTYQSDPPERAIDGNTDTWWTNGGTPTGWLRLTFPVAVAQTSYSIRKNIFAATRAPTAWTLEGSNNGGTSWTVLDTRSGIDWVAQTRTFSFTNSTAYLDYRLNVTANAGDGTLSISEFDFLPTWIVLDTRTGITWPTVGQIKTFAMPSAGAYPCYRLNVTSNNGDPSYTSIAEMGFIDVAAPFFDETVVLTDAPFVEREKGLATNKVGITDAVTTDLQTAESRTADVVPVTDAVTTDVFTVLPGSAWDPYVVTSSGSKVLDFTIVPTNPVAPWPFPYEGEGYSHSLWLTFTATDTQILTLTLAAPFPAGIEVWTGDTADLPDDLSNLDYGQGTLDVAIAPGQRILMRAHPLALNETRSGTLTWSVGVRSETGVLGFVCQSEVLETPGWLGVSLLSATPDSPVTFALDGGATFFTVTTEEDGTFAGDVALPNLTVGPHTITATDVSGQTETHGFAVTLSVSDEDTIPGSTPPVTAPSPQPVIHWVLEDPMPGGLGVYTFPVNPSEMSSPWPEKQIHPERSLHGSGGDIVWEGRADPVDWTVKGSILTQGFYDTLVAYQGLNRRLYVVDHHQRAWVVAFEGLTFEKKGRPDDWFHSYTARFTILGGPVTLS